MGIEATIFHDFVGPPPSLEKTIGGYNTLTTGNRELTMSRIRKIS